MLSVITLLLEFLILQAMSIFTDGRPVWLISLFIIVFTIVFCYDVTYSRRHQAISKPLILGYLFRIVLLYFDLYGRGIYKLPNSGADSEMFYRSAVYAARGIPAYKERFITLLSWAVRLLGESRLYLQFLLMLFSIVAILFVDKSLIRIGLNKKRRRTTAYFLALLPNFTILSSIFLRESIVAMLLSIAVYFFVKWWCGDKELDFWFAFAVTFVAALFHSGSVGVAMGMIIARLLANRKSGQVRVSITSILSAALFLFAFLYLYSNYAEILFSKMLRVESIDDIANTATGGGSSYAAYAGDSSTPLHLLIYTPIRMIMFQFSPFFWQIRGLSDIIAIVFDSFFYVYVYERTIRYITKRRPENRSLVILLFIIGLAATFVFAWGVANTGTALRHRNKLIAIFAVLLSLTADSKNDPVEQMVPASWQKE